MRAFFSAFGRTAFDYRLAYFILVSHTALMSSLVWYLGVKPHLMTASTYLSWSFTALLNIAAFYMLWVVLRLLFQGHAHPTAALKTKMAELLLRNDRLAHATHSTIVFIALIVVFGSVKSTIPAIVPFAWDSALIRIDRAIFGGIDPYILTSKLFGSGVAIVALNVFYNLWVIMVTGAMVWVPWIGDHTLRIRFILTMLLAWFLGGNILAIWFSSAGPCYVGYLSGDQTFAPLLKLLADVREDTGMVWALNAQEILWASYAQGEGIISGISALPSMHVAFAVIVACVAWRFGGARRWAAIAFALAIFIGSIQLAWHYAVDGIVGGALALLFWKASAILATWSLTRPEMTAEAV